MFCRGGGSRGTRRGLAPPAGNDTAIDQPLLAAQDVLGGVVTGRRGVARRDGVDDRPVLVLHRLHEVVAARFVPTGDPHAFAQVLLQKAKQQPELRIAGRIRR